METNILLPLLLTLGAGLATGIGSVIAFFARRTNKRLLSFSLGLSGGVMIYVSFVELFQQANLSLTAEWGVRTGTAVTVASFFAGILLIGVIDRLVPSFENPHEAHLVEEMDNQPRNPHLMRMGVMTALAIGIHNFPEGIATFTSAVDNMALGVAIAVAIAIHNIPEGMSVGLLFAMAAQNPGPAGEAFLGMAMALAVGMGLQNFPEGAAVSLPLAREGIGRGKAFLLGSLSGIVEPIFGIGVVLASGWIGSFMPWMLAFAAGAMVYVVVEELIPEAHLGEHSNVGTLGVIAGFVLMMVLDVALG